MSKQNYDTAPTRGMSYGFAAMLIAVGCAIAYGGAPAIADAAQQPSELSDQLVGGCTVLAIAVYSWILLIVMASLGERLGGSLGRLARGFARLVAPAGWRQSVRLAFGVAVVAVPAVGLGGAQAGADSMPVSLLGSPHRHANVSATGRSNEHGAIRLDGLPMPDRPAGPAVVTGVGLRLVVVHPGDSLWQIAARHLGPAATEAQVAAEWPRWYAANRSVIGDDPALITPGTVLHAPRDVRGENR